MKKKLVFRGEAYEPDDFTSKQINLINYRNDTISLLGTGGIDLSCTDCRNASDTARLHIEGDRQQLHLRNGYPLHYF
jgi:hypothetical protein